MSSLPPGPEARLAAFGLVLPPVPRPVARYVPSRLVGSLLFLSGQGPVRSDGSVIEGRVGEDVSVDDARAAARLTGLNLLAATRDALGTLDRVACVVKLFGMVNAVPGFRDHPRVIDGCSELLVDLFGEDGLHARSAVGMGSLPMNIPVEIEAVVAVKG